MKRKIHRDLTPDVGPRGQRKEYQVRIDAVLFATGTATRPSSFRTKSEAFFSIDGTAES